MQQKQYFQRLTNTVFVFAFLGFLVCPEVAGAQQSYRTRRSFQQPTLARSGASLDAHESSHPPRPAKFLGWRHAKRQGPDAVRYFQSLLSNKSVRPVTRIAANTGAMAGTPGGVARPESSGLLPSQLPGIDIRPSMPAGALPSGVVTGDFNGDGKLDWAVANGGDNTVYVYLGNGDGTSQPPILIPLVGQSPVGIGVGDLNGDGKLDLALAESDSNTVGILYGNGDGTFQPEIELSIANAQPLGIAVADVNNDGKPDLIVAIYGTGPATQLDFAVLLNEGGGQFSGPIYAPPLISDGIDEGFGIAVGDINGDGIPDLVVTGEDAYSTTVKTYFGKGDGSFTAGVLVWGGSPESGNDVVNAVLADVNGDHCLDITTAETIGLALVFYNDCSGNFPSAPSLAYGVADGAVSVAVADVNGDGLPDIITGSFQNPNAGIGVGYSPGNSLTVRLNQGNGSFGPGRVYVGDQGMFGLAVADLQNNGHPDILAANQDANSTTVYLNDGTGNFGQPGGGYGGYIEGTPTSPVNAPITGYLSADVDGDGKPDLVLVDNVELGSYNNTEPLTVMLNQGNGQFSLPIRSDVNMTGNVMDFVLADFRGVGRPDFLALTLNQASGPGPQLFYAQNLGGGQFGSPATLSFPSDYDYAFGTLAVGDFNGDGKLDFAVCTPTGTSSVSNPTADVLTTYLGNGDGTFSAPSSQLVFGNGADCQAMFVGLSGGYANIFMWLGSNGGIGNGLYEAIGNGKGTFTQPAEILSNLSQMTMVDLNDDGILDVVDIESGPQYGYLGSSPAQVNIYLGQFGGTFASPVTYTPYAGRYAVAVGSGEPDNLIQSFGPYIGDFNGDGIPDIAVFQYPGVTFTGLYAQIMIGNGDGTFTPSYDVFPFAPPIVPDLAVTNLLGDGKTAYVVSAGFTSAFQIFPSAQAPFLQTQMYETPVLSGNDALELAIDVPSSSSTSVSLSASDPNVQIPATVSIPAGQMSVEVPFSLAPTMPLNHWFSISAQSNGTTATSYNFEPAPGSAPAFLLGVTGGFTTTEDDSTPGPGESSLWTASVTSTGIGSSTFQVSCSGLPATASCTSFAPESFPVGPGVTNGDTFTITTQATIAPGSYPFTVTASDGFSSITSSENLRIGDFSLALQPSSLSAPPTGTANYTLTLTELYGYGESVQLGCSGLPAGASCALQGDYAGPYAQPFVINLSGVAPGNYTFTVTGTSPELVHSITGQLQVASQALANLNQTTLAFGTLLVGATSQSQSVTLSNPGNTALNLASIVAAAGAGANGSFAQTNNCGSSLAPAASCTINVTFSPTAVGNSPGTLTLTDNAQNTPQTLSLSGSAVDFSMGAASGSSTTVTISAGQNATYNLQIQGNQLSGDVGLTCSNAPPDARCTVNPSGVSVSGTAPIPFQVLIGTLPSSGIFPSKRELRIGTRFIPLAVFGWILLMSAAWVKPSHRRLRNFFAAYSLILALLAIASCGGGAGSGGGGSSGTPSGTYTITITGQCQFGSHTLNLTLVVQ